MHPEGAEVTQQRALCSVVRYAKVEAGAAAPGGPAHLFSPPPSLWARCPQLTQQVLTPSLRPCLPPSMSHTQRALLMGRLQGRSWGSPSAPPRALAHTLLLEDKPGGLLAAHPPSLWEGSAAHWPPQTLLPVHSKVLRGSPSRTGCERLRSSVSH